MLNKANKHTCFLTTLSSNQVIWLQGFFGGTYCFVTLCPSMVLDLSTDKLKRVSELLNIVIYLVYSASLHCDLKSRLQWLSEYRTRPVMGLPIWVQKGNCSVIECHLNIGQICPVFKWSGLLQSYFRSYFEWLN